MPRLHGGRRIGRGLRVVDKRLGHTPDGTRRAGISVNAMAPTEIGTDFSGGRSLDDPEYRQTISQVTAIGRPRVP
jgi:hypothetical protein